MSWPNWDVYVCFILGYKYIRKRKEPKAFNLEVWSVFSLALTDTFKHRTDIFCVCVYIYGVNLNRKTASCVLHFAFLALRDHPGTTILVFEKKTKQTNKHFARHDYECAAYVCSIHIFYFIFWPPQTTAIISRKSRYKRAIYVTHGTLHHTKSIYMFTCIATSHFP